MIKKSCVKSYSAKTIIFFKCQKYSKRIIVRYQYIIMFHENQLNYEDLVILHIY